MHAASLSKMDKEGGAPEVLGQWHICQPLASLPDEATPCPFPAAINNHCLENPRSSQSLSDLQTRHYLKGKYHQIVDNDRVCGMRLAAEVLDQ